MPRGKSSGNKINKQIDAVKHKDKRKNIPTEELHDFVKDDEQRPKEVEYPGLLYARDTSLDPQLVWKGKDQQDQEKLTVPAVPIYIQEKIHPQAIIEDLRAQAKKQQPDQQLGIFADFNGITFEDLIEFYQHEANWSNRMILGDSLLVMTSLAEKEGLKGRVQMIYLDPPYGIRFGSNWQVSTRKRDIKDGKAEDLTRQPEQIRAFRDTWELGIHSYLAYLRDRLIVARELLTETGSVFMQIGDENVHLVRCLMDEVFGSENFCAQITFKKTGGFAADILPSICDYILWYAKTKHSQGRLTIKYNQLYLPKDLEAGPGERYTTVELSDGGTRPVTEDEVDNPAILPKGAHLMLGAPLTSDGATTSPPEFPFNDKIYFPKGNQHWKTSIKGLNRLSRAERIFETRTFLNYKLYFDDFPASPASNIWTDTMGTAERNKVYVVQTATKIIERCLLMTTDPGDLVLDPTCGSGTTAYVAEQWGRRWITIDTSRVALALARTRLMAARFPYYLLADSQEGIKKEAEIIGRMPPAYQTEGDIKKGFVYKRVPHITLKSIANNEEIDKIHERYQSELEQVRSQLNKQIKKNWQEWEIPREADESWSKQVKELHAKWWELRRKRQKEIDAAILRNADQELLVDQPCEDNKRIRVTGPFTFETLSPHRTISVQKKKELEEVGIEGWKVKVVGAGQFGNIIIDNLRKAGVQNTIKNERLKFDRLETYAGSWIHAEGEYTEKDGKSRRVAVCIGPEHGTVGPELIKEAAKEAVQGIGFDLLFVCGFAFDPHVSEEVKRYGKLTILPTRMNSDLSMGDELLKKTGAGNLFMVFGEPDIEVRKNKDGKITVEIKGLDVYDPTTGQIRNSSTDDIACWFIDTNYNEESFFVRHAYFTGGDTPFEKLQRALKAEINEAAWSSLYSTISRTFDKPETGKIAVKVINHYGDEVLKVFNL